MNKDKEKEKVVDIREGQKPVTIDSPASRLIMGTLVIWLIELHFDSWSKEMVEYFFGEEGRAHYCRMGGKREDVDGMMDFLKHRYWLAQEQKKKAGGGVAAPTAEDREGELAP